MHLLMYICAQFHRLILVVPLVDFHGDGCKNWLTFLLVFILLTWPIQFNLLILKMRVYRNLQIAALVLYYIAFSNFDLLQFPPNILLKTSLSNAASRLAISLSLSKILFRMLPLVLLTSYGVVFFLLWVLFGYAVHEGAHNMLILHS